MGAAFEQGHIGEAWGRQEFCPDGSEAAEAVGIDFGRDRPASGRE
jgi:hypothetical protein